MISMAFSISDKPCQAKLEAVRELLARNHVEDILNDVKQNGNRERKKELPVWLPLAESFSNGTRKADDAQPSGLFFLDIDEKGLTEKLWQKVCDEGLVRECRLVYFAESAGGGTHIWAWRTPGSTIEEDIRRLADRLGVSYDSHVTDLARCCFMVSERYVKLLDPVVFEPLTEEQKALYAAPGAPRHEVKQEQAQTVVYPRDYKGVGYDRIVQAMLWKLGYGDRPVEGERNNALFVLSRYLRFVCDFNADWICQVIPHWGLPGHEVLGTVKSAVASARPNEMPSKLTEVLTTLEVETEAGQSAIQDDDDELAPAVPRKLPHMLQMLASHAPAEFREAVLMDALPMLGTLATGVRARYRDGKVHSPSFMVAMEAPQATGKSFASDLQRLLLDPILKQDDVEWAKETAWVKACKECGKGERPEDPEAKIRVLPATLSNTMLLKRACYARGEHLFTYAPEVETVTKGNKAGAWSQKNDLFRIAFDNEEWGQLYMSDQSFSGKTRLYYNVLLCGTPRTMLAFFSNVEDGLVTRFSFVRLPDMMGARMPKFQTLTKEEEDMVKRQCVELMDEKGEVELPLINKAIDDWDEGKRHEYLKTLRPAVDVFRRRAAVIGFRAGMIGYELCGKQEAEEAIELAVWVAERTFHYQMELFGNQVDLLNSEMPVGGGQRSTADLLSLLGKEFTKDDLVRLRVAHGQSPVVKSVIHRWKEAELIEKVAPNVWRKL